MRKELGPYYIGDAFVWREWRVVGLGDPSNGLPAGELRGGHRDAKSALELLADRRADSFALEHPVDMDDIAVDLLRERDQIFPLYDLDAVIRRDHSLPLVAASATEHL